MIEPVSLDLFPDDVLPSVVDRQPLVFARFRFLFWLDGCRGCHRPWLSREHAFVQLVDTLACLGGLGGVW